MSNNKKPFLVKRHKKLSVEEPEINENTNINRDATLDITGKLTVCEGVVIGKEALVLTHQHAYHLSKKPIRKNKLITRIELIIGKDVFIGERAIILPQVTFIPKGCFVAAGSVLTKNSTGEYEIWAGNPARKIGVRGETKTEFKEMKEETNK